MTQWNALGGHWCPVNWTRTWTGQAQWPWMSCTTESLSSRVAAAVAVVVATVDGVAAAADVADAVVADAADVHAAVVVSVAQDAVAPRTAGVVADDVAVVVVAAAAAAAAAAAVAASCSAEAVVPVCSLPMFPAE